MSIAREVIAKAAETAKENTKAFKNNSSIRYPVRVLRKPSASKKTPDVSLRCMSMP
jgi:hypothetical protein